MTNGIGRVGVAVVAAGVYGALALATPVVKASPAELAQGAVAPAMSTPPAGETAPKGPLARVEARISDLHAKLHITAAQEPPFTAMAEVMRENAKAMAALMEERGRSSNTTALAALRWYARLTEAHAEALKKFVPAFEKLYVDLSAEQQQAADVLFRRFAEQPVPRKVRAK